MRGIWGNGFRGEGIKKYKYKWNVNNRTNKRAKYKQTHGNKEYTDSNQKGGERAITGQRMGRNMYKGSMDKDKGEEWD